MRARARRCSRETCIWRSQPWPRWVLVQVLKEPKRDHLALQLRQGRQQAGQGQQVLRLLPGCRRDHQLAE
jgi:hypothetical protein